MMTELIKPKKASPPELRDCLMTANEFAKAGVAFVVVPIFIPEHKIEAVKMVNKNFSIVDLSDY